MDTKERKKLHRWEQKNRWMTHYELKYGVLPIEYGPPVVGSGNGTPPAGGGYALDSTPTVLKAKCRFCECFGREALASELLNNKAVAAAAAAAAGIEFPGSPMASSGEALDENSSNAGDLQANGQPPLKRRKKRQTLKVFGPNFRTDNLESHLTREHPIKWKEYERLRDSEKKAFFPDGAGDAASKDLLMAQHAAVANAVSVMGLSRTMGVNSNGGALLHTASSSGLKLSGSASYAASLDKVMMPVTKQMVSTEIMVLVEQLLASSVLRQQQASLQQDANATLPTVNWQSFVREDDRLAELAAAMAANMGEAGATISLNAAAGSVVTGECKAVSGDFCTISLKNEALFLYIVEVLSARQSLDTTLTMVHAAQRLVPDASMLLQGVTLADLSGAVHQLMGLNLSSISQLMSYAWGYSLFLRFVTHHGTGFLDVRVQVAVNDEIHDLHLVAIPLDETKHTVDAVGGMIVKALTAVDARALEKIVGLTIDGDHYHMHKYKSIGAWLKKQTEDATSQAAFYVLYSGAYHISFIVDELLDHCQADQEFLTSLAEVEAMCRGNMSLRGAMGPEPTRFASAHWVSIFNACEWLTVHRDTILKWGAENEHQLAKLPSIQWWVTLYVVRDVLKDVYVAYKKCRESCSSFADVQKYLRDLIFQIRLKFNITQALPSETATSSGTPSSAAASDLAASLTAVPGGASVSAADQLDPCEFSYQDFVGFVISLDLFMYDAFQVKSIDGINDVDRVALYQRFHLVLMLLINKVLAVINSSPDSPVPPASTDATANASTGTDAVTPHQYAMQIPPSTPYEFITINNLAAMDMLNQQRFRIKSKWTGKVLSMITEDRNRMMAEFGQPGALYEAVNHGMKQYQSGAFSFRDAWKQFSVEFASLASFAIVFGGLLSVTRTNEDELEHYFYTMNKYAGSNLALEAQLHASQFHKISALRRHGDATIV